MDAEEMKARIAYLEAENQRLRYKVEQLETAIKQFAKAIGKEV